VSYRTKLAKPINYVLRPMRAQLVHRTSSDRVIHYWRPARKTIAAAQKAGLPLGAYPDKRFAKPGATPDTVRAMLKLGDLHDKCGVRDRGRLLALRGRGHHSAASGPL
jgi:hypothetical protein